MLKGYAQLICLYLLQLLRSSAPGDLFIVKVKCVGEEVSCGLRVSISDQFKMARG